MKRFVPTSLMFVLALAAGCASSPKEADPRTQRAPANAKDLTLEDSSLDAVVCSNSPTSSEDYFHYVLDLRQRVGDENGAWTWVKSGDVVVVQDYNHGSGLSNYGNFLARLEITEASLKLTGVPAGTTSNYHSYRSLVSKPNFSLTWSPQGGQVQDSEKERRMTLKGAPVNCFQPRMQLE